MIIKDKVKLPKEAGPIPWIAAIFVNIIFILAMLLVISALALVPSSNIPDSMMMIRRVIKTSSVSYHKYNRMNFPNSLFC